MKLKGKVTFSSLFFFLISGGPQFVLVSSRIHNQAYLHVIFPYVGSLISHVSQFKGLDLV